MRIALFFPVSLLAARGLIAGQPAAVAAADEAVVAGSVSAASDNTSAKPELQEIVVTGTRIVRNGYQAPTPVSVLGIDEIQASATPDVADALNQLPSFVGSVTPRTQTGQFGSGGEVVNGLNLRNLGQNRTLVLIDGQRTIANSIRGVVDVNDIPQQLVSRVEVVTGGASAVYGSDAVAGVVNFILDKNFTGLKAEASGGATTYGDDRNWQVAMTWGSGFAGDRGHILLSGEAMHNAGVFVPDRAWNRQGWQVLQNPNYTPTNGQPQNLVLPHTTLSVGTLGGIVTDGPFQGTAFGAGGTPYQFQYGNLVSFPDMQGGEWQTAQIRPTAQGASLAPEESHRNLFTRIGYDLNNNIQVFEQFSLSDSRSHQHTAPIEMEGGFLSVATGNPFIPPSVQAQMTAQGVDSLPIGTLNGDLAGWEPDSENRVIRNVVGAGGDFRALDTKWTWDAYYQYGSSVSTQRLSGDVDFGNYLDAIDAVTNPANGAIVCRSTLTDPNNGCHPYNMLGTGVNSAAAIAYVTGNGTAEQATYRFKQNVAAMSVRGDPFHDWAGPISVALGLEHRKEAVTASTDPISQNSGWFIGYQPIVGSYHVTEGFAEAVVPLAKDAPWAKALDLNGAVRATSYSVSGYVTTWKVGFSYSPTDDLRFRATRSVDIRAPDLDELFHKGGQAGFALVDPFNGSIPAYNVFVNTAGDPNLRPEKSKTSEVGIVYEPSMLPGFSASVDYWNFDIADGITTLQPQTIVDECFAGNQQLCSAITRTNGQITQINSSQFNLASQVARGVDMESSYRTSLARVIPGDYAFRLLATRYIKNYYSSPGLTPIEGVGALRGSVLGAAPKWRGIAFFTYSAHPFSVTLDARFMSSGKYDNAIVQCTSACPPSTVTNPTYNDNHIPGYVYLDAALSYRFNSYGEVFFNVANIANRAPAVVADISGDFSFDHPATTPAFYDTLGRTLRAGVRLKF